MNLTSAFRVSIRVLVASLAALSPCYAHSASSALGTTGNHQDELKVAHVRSISRPGYGAGQCTFGIRDPWNYDRSRLMYNEGANFTGKQPYYYWSHS